MRRLLALVQSTRLYLAMFTVPPALLWIAPTDGVESGLGGAAPLLLLAHTLLVIVHATAFDSATLIAGGSPRFALSRDEDLYDPGISGVTRWIASAAVVVLAVLLLIALRPVASILVFASLGLVTMLTGGVSSGSRRYRLMFAEVLWPALMLIVPMILFGAMRKAPLPPGAVPVTIVFALLVSVYVLLCEIRDQPLDAGQGMRTAITMVGRGVGTLLVFLGFAAAILVATRAASMGYWHWTAPGVVALAALVCTWSLPSRNEDAAPALWMLACGYAALVAMTG